MHVYKTFGIPDIFNNEYKNDEKLILKYLDIKFRPEFNNNDDVTIFGLFKTPLSLNKLKKAEFNIQSSYNSGNVDLLWFINNNLFIPSIPLNTLKIINKLSEVDKDFYFILHFYYMLIPDYESYNIALEIGL